MTEVELLLKIEDFKWHTNDGKILSIDEMETRHIFNCLKMHYNHIAELYGLPTIWFTHKYVNKLYAAINVPESLFETILIFAYTIEKRGDLPDKYKHPYNRIKEILLKSDYKHKDMLSLVNNKKNNSQIKNRFDYIELDEEVIIKEDNQIEEDNLDHDIFYR